MKKIAKKLSAMALAVVMLAALCIPALATSTPTKGSEQKLVTPDSKADVVVGVADPSKENWTSANGSDHLLAYQVVSITYDETENTLDYQFTPLFKEFLEGPGKTTWGGLTPEGYGEQTEDELKSLLGAFTAYIKGQESMPKADHEETANSDGVATFKEMPMGQYIIVGNGTSKGAKIYQTVTAEVRPEVVTDKGGHDSFMLYESYDVSMKTSTPDLTKDITGGTVTDTGDESKQTASIGDTVKYKLTISVPTYPEGSRNTTFYVGDKLSDGLALNKEAKDFVVTGIDDGGNETVLTEGYTIDTVGDDNHTFYIDFDMSDKGTLKHYAQVTIEYSAKLTDAAALGTIMGNPNDAELIWSNSPFDGITWKPGDDDRPTGGEGYGKDEDKKIVYTYALAIDKYDEKMPWEKLEGAVFDVYLAGSGDAIPGTDNKTGVKLNKTVATDANGVGILKGLEAGTYYLVETKAPSGFNLMETAMEMKIDSGSTAYTVTENATVTQYVYTTKQEEAMEGHKDQATDKDGKPLYLTADNKVTTVADGNQALYVKSEKVVEEVTEIVAGDNTANGYYEVGVPNATGAQLPSTGGVGTTIFYIVGGCLVLGAVILLITKRRMGGTED